MIVVIDDERSFADGRRTTYLRSCAEALAFLQTDTPIDQLWLDHDLGPADTDGNSDVVPVVNFLLERAVWDNPYPVAIIYVHTANSVGVDKILSLGKFYLCKRVGAVENNLIKV